MSRPTAGTEDDTREAYLAARLRHDVPTISRRLVELALNDPDWRWVQGECLRLLDEESTDERCRYIAVLCLEHVLRVHGVLDFREVLPRVNALADDPDEMVRGAVESFLDVYRGFEPMQDYLPRPTPDPDEFLRAREEGRTTDMLRQLLSLARDEAMWGLAETWSLELLDDPEPETRRVAVLALSEVQGCRGRIDFGRVLPRLRALRERGEAPRELERIAEVLCPPIDIDGYSPWVEPNREQLLNALECDDAGTAGVQLTALALEDESWRWVQDVCLRLVHDRDPRIRVLAVKTLDNLLYFRGELDRDAVVPTMRELESDEALAEPVRGFFRTFQDASVPAREDT
ncbi:MAG TPA: hypothetical protein VF053_09995 [Streptosporangiales bacterium]